MTVPNPTVQVQGAGSVNGEQLNTFVQACASVAQMRSLSGVGQMMLYLEGLMVAGDGGQGPFIWSATSIGPDDGVNVIMPTGSQMGAWVRLGIVTPTPPPPSTAAQVFRASVKIGGGALWRSSPVIVVPYDTIDFDTTGGFSLTQAVPSYGTLPAFKVPTTGYWRFESDTQFFDNTSGTDSVTILKAFSVINSDGSGFEYYQFNSALQAVAHNAPASSQTFSVGGRYLTHCTAGQFVFVNDDLESASSSSTLTMNSGSATLCCTYFSGEFIGQ